MTMYFGELFPDAGVPSTYYSIPFNPHKNTDVVGIIILILQVRKLKLREMRQASQSDKRQVWYLGSFLFPNHGNISWTLQVPGYVPFRQGCVPIWTLEGTKRAK